jgi:hypothetical protein
MDSKRDLVIWAAGFIDGEGCISINRQKHKDHNWWCYTLSLAVSQKTEEPLRRLKEIFGGSMYSYKGYGVTYWRWQLWSHGALRTIKELFPYLLVKREIADTAIRFQEQMTAWNRRHGRRGYPDHVIAGRDVFYQEARALNARNRANHKEPKYVGPQATLKPPEEYDLFHAPNGKDAPDSGENTRVN